MNEQESFLAAIRLNPDDDTPRLIYADWLEEHGEIARPEFIRLQCALARPGLLLAERYILRQREMAVFQRMNHVMLPGHDSPKPGAYQRGFLKQIDGDIDEIDASLQLLQLQEPIQQIVLQEPTIADVVRLVKHPISSHLPELVLRYLNQRSLPTILNELSRMPRLRCLTIVGPETGDAWNRTFTLCGFNALEELRLIHSSILRFPMMGEVRQRLLRLKVTCSCNQSVEFINGDSPFTRLNSLSLDVGRLANIDMFPIHEEGTFPAMRYFSMKANGCGTAEQASLSGLMASDWLRSVERLSLIDNSRAFGRTLDEQYWMTAIAAGIWPNLRYLTLQHREISSLTRLAKADFPNLCHLNLSHNHLGDSGAKTLAEMPWLHQLRSLNLDVNMLGSRGITNLMRGPLSKLRRLSVSGNRIGGNGAIALAGNPNLRNLRQLIARGNRFDADTARMLLRSVWRDKLASIDLRNNQLPATVQAELMLEAGERMIVK